MAVTAKRITLITIGSTGDLYPFIALGMGLKDTGYQVTLASHFPYRDKVESHGLSFFPLPGDPYAIVHSEEGRDLLETSTNPVDFTREFMNTAGGLMADLYEDIHQACQGSVLLIVSTFGFPGHHVAEALRIPCISAMLQPATRTRAFPAVSVTNTHLGGSLNYLSYFISEQVFLRFVYKQLNRWRVESLGLAPLEFWGPFRYLYTNRVPFLYGISPSVLIPPDDYPPEHHVTGYWFLPGDPDYQPPNELTAFLEAGEPPVYIGFGSMSVRDPEAHFQLILDALEQAGMRGIIASGWAGLSQPDLPDSVYQAGYIPHDWLFPRMAAVVHHGGAGTTANGLRAGVPNIVVPFFGDQPYWGSRVHDLGAGPKSIPNKKLTAEKLAEAIGQAVNDPTIRENARSLGERIRQEAGVTRAVEIINRMIEEDSIPLPRFTREAK